MANTLELYAKVREYIEKRCPLDDLQNWLAPRLAEYLAKPDSEASILASRVAQGALRVNGGAETEEGLRRELRKGKVPDFRHELGCPLCNTDLPYRSSGQYQRDKYDGYYTYVCRNCFLVWEHMPGDPPNILSAIEDSEAFLKTRPNPEMEARQGLRCPFCGRSRPYRSPPAEDYVYVCQGCGMSWEQKPGGEITLGQTIESCRNTLIARAAKERKVAEAVSKAIESAYAQWWWQTHR